jgi:outer membrane murein-binding lipoprotein Lpp
MRSFVKMTLGAPTGVDVDSLKAENEQLRAKVADLQAQLDSLASKVGND